MTDSNRRTVPDQVFYRFQSADGRVLLVDDLEKLPPEARSKAERIQYEGSPSAIRGALEQFFPDNEVPSPTVIRQPTVALDALHLPSFGLGAAAGMGALVILWWMFASRNRSFGKRILISLLITGGLAAVLSSLYLGWLRRSTGQDDRMLATPAELIDDAKRTMQVVEERRKEQQKQLEELGVPAE